MQVEPGLHVTEDCTICPNNLPELYLDEVVEGVDMLLDESLDFEESWEKVPFVLELFHEQRKPAKPVEAGTSHLCCIDRFR